MDDGEFLDRIVAEEVREDGAGLLFGEEVVGLRDNHLDIVVKIFRNGSSVAVSEGVE